MKAVVVIHSRSRSLINNGTYMEWHIVTMVGRPYDVVIDVTEASKSEALAVIKKLGLIEAHTEKDGQIYDTPDHSLKALFPQGLNTDTLKKLNAKGL